jgi:hypothetical protein
MDIPKTKRILLLLKIWNGKRKEGKEKLENLILK